jgi:hypothetical protein
MVRVNAAVAPLALPARSHWIAWTERAPSAIPLPAHDQTPIPTRLEHAVIPSTNTSTRPPSSPVPENVTGPGSIVEPGAGSVNVGSGGGSLSIATDRVVDGPASEVPGHSCATVTEYVPEVSGRGYDHIPPSAVVVNCWPPASMTMDAPSIAVPEMSPAVSRGSFPLIVGAVRFRTSTESGPVAVPPSTAYCVALTVSCPLGAGKVHVHVSPSVGSPMPGTTQWGASLAGEVT